LETVKKYPNPPALNITQLRGRRRLVRLSAIRGLIQINEVNWIAGEATAMGRSGTTAQRRFPMTDLVVISFPTEAKAEEVDARPD